MAITRKKVKIGTSKKSAKQGFSGQRGKTRKVKALKKSAGRMARWQVIEKDGRAMLVASGAGLGVSFGPVGGLIGLGAGIAAVPAILRFAKKKHEKISVGMIAELSGRPRLAEKILPQFRDPAFQSLIIQFAKNGKKMNKREREKFVEMAETIEKAKDTAMRR